MARLGFEKYEGLGNDFLIVDAGSNSLIETDQVKRLCDRHFGVGGDGVLIVSHGDSPGARARMVVLNADGSRPEGCGNGLRCVALHLARSDALASTEYVIDTDAGPRVAHVERNGDEALITVGMGRGVVGGEHVAQFRGKDLHFQLISMGNPHAILFDGDYDEAALDQLGPLVSGSLPGGSNVELVTAKSERKFDLIVWERGVGRTLACGTGAAATGVAASITGRAPFGEPLEIGLPGGPLEATVDRGSLEVTIRGPARYVFSGEVSAR
jgi:diaminopimelate epimerase